MSTHKHNDTTTFGFWVYLMSDCVLFATLFATYAVLRATTFGGPSAEDLTNLPYVFLETIILLTSSFTMGLAVHFAANKAARAKKEGLTWPSGPERTLFLLLAATLLLGLSFLGLEVHEFAKLIAEGSGPGRSAFLSSFFALVGTHGLHVFVGSVWMAVLILRAWKKGWTESNVRKLALLSLFWHFLDVIWIFIFTIVYLVGVLL